MTKETRLAKLNRMGNANRILQEIAFTGRRFFYQKGMVSRFEFVKNRLYFYDSYSEKLLPLSHPRSDKWRRWFTNGGTMHALIMSMSDYIKVGRKPCGFGPWVEEYCNGDLWGYGFDNMVKIRKVVNELTEV